MFPDVHTILELGLTKCASNSPSEGMSFISNLCKTAHQFNKSQSILNAETIISINGLAIQFCKPFVRKSIKYA